MNVEQDVYDREKKALGLTEAALCLEKSERVSFLMNACAGDTALQAYCISLVNHEISDEDFLSLVYGSDEKDQDSTDATNK